MATRKPGVVLTGRSRIERNRDHFVRRRVGRAVARQIVEEEGVVQPQEDRGRVVARGVVELLAARVAAFDQELVADQASGAAGPRRAGGEEERARAADVILHAGPLAGERTGEEGEELAVVEVVDVGQVRPAGPLNSRSWRTPRWSAARRRPAPDRTAPAAPSLITARSDSRWWSGCSGRRPAGSRSVPARPGCGSARRRRRSRPRPSLTAEVRPAAGDGRGQCRRHRRPGSGGCRCRGGTPRTWRK